MNRRFVGLLLVASVIFGVALAAVESPPADFQALMQSNGRIVDISLGTIRNVGGPGVGQGGVASLRVHMRAKDYGGVAMDGATLKANFMKIQAFWTERKVPDAVKWSQEGSKASGELEAAAKAGDDAAISKAANAVATTCRECHQAHRVVNLADGSFQIL